MNKRILELVRGEILNRYSKSLKQPYRRWYLLHSKYVGIASTEIDPEHNPEIYLLCGWLHDITKAKKDENHQRRGAEYAEKLLKDKVDSNELEIIVDCIKNHGSSGKPRTYQARVFQTADKLALFYPEQIRYALKQMTEDELKVLLRHHYKRLKMLKAKKIARGLLKRSNIRI
ncbi:HD domain-containing protein [Candidatus Pacearchaeota archaeon]|nr:HD domain-containing protein [Candidatus Pacearchaeota archaeon]